MVLTQQTDPEPRVTGSREHLDPSDSSMALQNKNSKPVEAPFESDEATPAAHK